MSSVWTVSGFSAWKGVEQSAASCMWYCAIQSANGAILEMNMTGLTLFSILCGWKCSCRYLYCFIRVIRHLAYVSVSREYLVLTIFAVALILELELSASMVHALEYQKK